MAESDDGVNESLAWATDSQLLDELSSRYDSMVFAGNKRTTENSGRFWHRLRGCPFACSGLVDFLGESSREYMLETFPLDGPTPDDDDDEDWKRG